MTRALLVIDVQNEYFTGALPITHPAGHLEQILQAMDQSAGKVLTVVVQHHFPQPEMPFFQKGTPGWELHRSILCAQQMLLSDVITVDEWLNRLA